MEEKVTLGDVKQEIDSMKRFFMLTAFLTFAIFVIVSIGLYKGGKK